MAITGMIDQIGRIRTMIGVLMGRLGEEPQFMIGWGADSACMPELVIVSGIFPETKKSLKKWRMQEMADARVPDEFIFCRDANTYPVESRENRRQSVRQPQHPPWCREGLTRTQKRRLQRERQEELSKDENSAKSGDRQ